MRTDKQKEASKTNGAKSNGPVTPKGKARSSRNGMRHNLSSGHVVLLSNEDPDVFIEHSFGFLDRYAPADYVERDLVNQMIAASWRLARISAIECSLAEIEMDLQAETHDEVFSFLDAHARQTLSLFGNVDKEGVSRMLQRYASSAGRAYSRAFRMLKELQGDRFNRRPDAPPVSPGLNHVEARRASEPRTLPENPTPEPTQELQEIETGAITETSYAPRIIVINRRRPENVELQTEPEIEPKETNPPFIYLEKAMCA